MAEMFRKKALEKLQSPERLDELLLVTTPKSWLALLALCVIVASGVVWGVYGRVVTQVGGTGIIIRSGGVLHVVATGRGHVAAFKCRVNDVIEKGQIVAVLKAPDVVTALRNKRAQLLERKQDLKEKSRLIEAETQAKMRTLARQRHEVEERIGVQENRLQWVDKRIVVLTDLYEKGLVKEKELADCRLDRDTARLQIHLAQKDLSHIIAQEVEMLESKENRISAAGLEINDIEREVLALKERVARTIEVRSDISCRVLRILPPLGDLVNEGQPIISGEHMESPQELTVFVDSFQARRIEPGMEVEFTPSIVKREEYGYMLATVKSVSEFPVPAVEMDKVLGHPRLTRLLTEKGPVSSVTCELQMAGSTFKWSSRRGASVKTGDGMLGTATVIVRSQAPVTLVIPTLKRWLGVG